MTDTRNEFLADWFVNAKLSPIRRQPSLTYFGIDASQPLGRAADSRMHAHGLTWVC